LPILKAVGLRSISCGGWPPRHKEAIMTVRVLRSHAPLVSFRLLAAPAAVGALLVAAVSKVRRSVAEPGMPRMSNEWLLSHEQLVGRRESH
jgi:hypothetical protein